ncbi:MAG: hypothetical protein VX090_16800 [Pseudomonadota bacterium]|nr:hypothetical protein [Pseudomonadota bacterium]
MSTVDIRKNRERVLKKMFAELVIEARTADGQWLTEELHRQQERQALKQAGLLAQPTASLLQFPQSPEPDEQS